MSSLGAEPQEAKSPETRWVPEGEFVASIDELLGKHLPDRAVPWPESPVPLWVQGFAPRVIVDLGCGVGGFTCSVLTRLGMWGCLSQLERIVLVERDTTILPGGVDALRKHLVETVTNVLSVFGKEATDIVVVFENIELIETESGHLPSTIPLLDRHCAKADLIVASHLTYYFSDGSGREFTESLLRNYLEQHGRLWCVIRKRHCPIYEARATTLKALGSSDVKPFDYAEYFVEKVIPQLDHVKLLDKKDQGFLWVDKDAQWKEAAYRLMWRESPTPEWETPYAKAVSNLVELRVPLFDERHFILGRLYGG